MATRLCWADLTDEDEEVRPSDAAGLLHRRNPKAFKEGPPVLCGFAPSSFATEWGSRWVQERLVASSTDLKLFATVCRHKADQLAMDVHAHHALRKALQLLAEWRLSCPFSEPILAELSPKLATHVFGCRVIVAAAAFDGRSAAATQLVDEVLQQAAKLVLHHYGSYALQAAVWHRAAGSRRGFESVSQAMQAALPLCRKPWSLACMETSLEVQLPGLAMAAALSEVVPDGPGAAPRLGVLRWVMRDPEARPVLLARLSDRGHAPWLIIGEMLGRKPSTYQERLCHRKKKARSCAE